MTDIKIPNKILDSFNTRQEVELRKIGDAVYDGVLEKLQDSGDLLISDLGDVDVLNPDDRDLLQFDFGLQEWVNVPIEEIYAPQVTNVVFAGPTTGSPAFPAFRSLVEADIPAIPSTKISDSTVIGRSLVTAANAAAGRTAIAAAADAEVVKLTGAQTVAGAKTFSSLMSVTVGSSVGGNTAIRISPVGGALGQESEILAGSTFTAGWAGPDTTPRYTGVLRYGDAGGTNPRNFAWKFLTASLADGTPTERARITSVGLGLGGVTAPTCSIDTNGFTKLGELAPKTKFLKITGTMPGAGLTSSIAAHGLTASKILSCDVLVTLASGIRVLPHSGATTDSSYYYISIAASTIDATVLATGTLVASRPVTVLLTYEE